jgi:hypothetical protein
LIAIHQDDDWEQLRNQLALVVDPTIFRTAEVFLQGERAAQDKRALWQAISANVGSLAAFIDAIVLNEKLPRPNRAVTVALKAAGRELFAD